MEQSLHKLVIQIGTGSASIHSPSSPIHLHPAAAEWEFPWNSWKTIQYVAVWLVPGEWRNDQDFWMEGMGTVTFLLQYPQHSAFFLGKREELESPGVQL